MSRSSPGSARARRRLVCRGLLPCAVAAAALPGCKPNAAPARAADKRGTIRFSDQTAAAGVNWRHSNGVSGRFFYPELVGGGGGFVDVDGDGWLDLVLIQSGALLPPGGAGAPHALYLNNGDGTFRDASVKSGLRGPHYGMGVAAGDYDADGRVDLFITGVHDSRLFKNLGGGRFQDVTSGPLKNAGHWGTSASWADVDGDGRLDLFIGNYVRWTPASDDVPCIQKGIRTHCGPKSYGDDRCVLLLNRGGGRFEDVSRSTGLTRLPAKALGVNTCDINGDGAPDFFVTCDQDPNLLLRSRGKGRFEEVAMDLGVAMPTTGLARAGMGVAMAEEEPGLWSIWIGNFTREGTSYYRQSAEGLFQDAAEAAGLASITSKVLTFGLVARDFDTDGRVDLGLANGHVSLDAERTRDEPTRQRPLIFQRRGDVFAEVSDTAGSAFAETYVARGLAAGDYDNDGDLDLLMVENGGPVHLWRNDSEAANSWVGVECVTREGSPALGARVELRSRKRTQVRWTLADGSYLAAQDSRCLFAAESGQLGGVTVRWPDGATQQLDGLQTGRYRRVTQRSTPSAGTR
jgi:enediyne biosynthesis protein E4